MKESMKNVTVFFLFILTIFISSSCNVFINHGRAEISINKNKKFISDLDTIEIQNPFGYYCINWQIFFYEEREPNFGTRGCTPGDKLFGSWHWMNNYMDTNQLNIDSLNQVLKSIEVEKPYMIWYNMHKSGYDSTWTKGCEFIMFTKDKNLYNDKVKLMVLARNYNK